MFRVSAVQAANAVSKVRAFRTETTARVHAAVEQRLIPEVTGPLSGYRVLDLTRVLGTV